MERYICIHGHFYQPPRENPWLEAVELDDSAYPYHDWNARLTAQCYAPNAAARILSDNKSIIEIINNYERISFNFGPTILHWMQRHAPEEYAAIINADKESIKRFSGHGCAIAQCYNHMIMPLANSRDKRTQIKWGIRDFLYRFGRHPEGMWLPETAVDIETLEILAEHEIKFTILVPRQAKSVRKIGQKEWINLKPEEVDPKKPYLCNLPSGRKIALFFAHGTFSLTVAMGNLLDSGENFANTLLSGFSSDDYPQLMHIATDGETFGHHHHHGDMALAYCLHHIDSKKLAKITNYGEFLEKFPPQYEIQIHENSSWSCIHGVERWRADCGCNSGGHPGWNQKWRAILREAMDFIRNTIAPVFEFQMKLLGNDPWKIRDEYIDVALDRSEEKVNEFLQSHAHHPLSSLEKTQFLKLLEMQRNCMLMYASCGWFFDEISGIEGVQILQFAARAIQLAKETSGMDLEQDFKSILAGANSNINSAGNGAKVYEMLVQPAQVDLNRVGAHFAVSSAFHEETENLYCYSIENLIFQRWEVGGRTLAIGRIKIYSNVTLEEHCIDFSALHMVDNNVFAGVKPCMDEGDFTSMSLQMQETFLQGTDIAAVIRVINFYFGAQNYSLWHTFRDQQRKIFKQILSKSMKEIGFTFRYFYERHYPMMLTMHQMLMPIPLPLAAAAEITLNNDIVDEIEKEDTDLDRLQNLVTQIKKGLFKLDAETVSYAASTEINMLTEKFRNNPEDLIVLELLVKTIKILRELPIQFDIWKAQNIFFSISKKMYEKVKTSSEQNDPQSVEWIKYFNALAENLEIKIN